MIDSSSGRLLAVDPGTARHGLAVSNPSRTMAFPRGFIPASADAPTAIAAVVREEEVAEVVVGLPLGLDGREGAAAVAARTLAAALVEAVGETVAVSMVDERFTTVSASQAMRDAGKSHRDQRGGIDSAAATVLLQSVLDGGVR